MTIARDLAERMDFDSGQVRYCLDGMVARLGVSRATVSRHVAYLRELGALVWVERGSRANVRRSRGLGGYAGTATVYAAVIPAVYDQAHGHTLVGSGYTARVVIDQRGTTPASAHEAEAVDNSSVDNLRSAACETPSRTGVKEVGQQTVVGGCRDTSRKRASQPKTRIPHQSTPVNGRRRTAADVRRAERTVRVVRALVTWTQPVPLRRLEYVLRPLTDQGLDAHEIAAELTALCSGTRWWPQRPDMFICQRLAGITAYDQQLTDETEAPRHSTEPMSNPEWSAWIELQRRRQASAAKARTDADRAAARLNWNIWPEVITHLEEDHADALDLYGAQLCSFAVSQAARHDALTGYV
ncbi:hypothetical protein [Streptomyces melanogenes]|uniref:hypothetical protein n=1 Tax=Streptomyces melanogenes TaxID=67326 RepID=UPI00167D2217|nr:hypothetical protein [Streptomyces melanogenes]